jgi:hypothetical protein
MGVLKGLSLGILGFLLFISLLVFGIAYTVNGTALSPAFITKEINKVDVSQIVGDFLEEDASGDGDIPPEVRDSLVETIGKVETEVKERLAVAIRSTSDYLRGKKDDPELSTVLSETFFNSAFVNDLLQQIDLSTIAEEFASSDLPADIAEPLVGAIAANEAQLKANVADTTDPIFSYLLGRSSSINLATTLRNSLFTTEFATALIEELDLSAMAADFLVGEATAGVSSDMSHIVDDVQELMVTIEPTIRKALVEAADQILDYLLGQHSTVLAVVHLSDVTDELEAALRQAHGEFLPAGWDLMTPAQQDEHRDEFVASAMAMIPETLEIDQTAFDQELLRQISDALEDAERALASARADIADALYEAETSLVEPRRYIGYFVSGYSLLLVAMGLLALGIILIHRQVSGSTRQLGIILLVYGIIQLVAVVLTRGLIMSRIDIPDMPVAFQHLPEMLIRDVTGVLQVLSIGAIAVGLVLVGVSIAYPRLRPPARN